MEKVYIYLKKTSPVPKFGKKYFSINIVFWKNPFSERCRLKNISMVIFKANIKKLGYKVRKICKSIYENKQKKKKLSNKIRIIDN